MVACVSEIVEQCPAPRDPAGALSVRALL